MCYRARFPGGIIHASLSLYRLCFWIWARSAFSAGVFPGFGFLVYSFSEESEGRL